MVQKSYPKQWRRFKRLKNNFKFKKIFHWKAMSRDHFIHVIKPKIIQRMKVNDLFNHYLECGMQPLITMKWNGDLLIEFGVGEKAIVLDTGLNIKKFGDVIDEEN